jgi:putative MATE family efflux protein
MKMLDMPDEVMTEAVTYLSIWFAGISGLMIYNMGSAIMRAVGDSRRPFRYLVVAAVTNTVLDLLFVIVFDWGVAGVAAATIIAQGLSATLTVISLCRNDSCVKISFRGMKFHKPIMKEIFVIGFPAALQMTITAFSNIFVQSYINFFGMEVMGGWTAYNKVGQLVLLPMQSVSLASTTFVGQNIGQNQVKRAEKGANISLLITVLSTAVISAPIMIFTRIFVTVFTPSPDIIDYGTLFIRLMIPFYLLWCVNQVYSGALRGVGKSTGPMVIMLSSFVAFRQVYLFVMANFISNTVVPIVMSFPAGWVLSAIITLIYYKITGLRPKGKGEKDLERNNVVA